jgi:hypothetical protein
VSGVPQSWQNVRVTGGVLLKCAGSPCTKRKRSTGKVTQATTGEPAARRQVRQWQTIVFVGEPWHS